MAIYIGIDGGGTGCRGIVATSDDQLLAEAQGGVLNAYAASRETVEANLRDLIDRLLTWAGLDAGKIAGIGAGVAGIRTPEERARLSEMFAGIVGGDVPLRLANDLDIGLRGGTTDGVGVVIVAGTGSSAFGRWADGEALVGGWGENLGDEGSGHWMGMQALQAVARAEDGREGPTALRERLLACVGATTVRDLVPWARAATKAEVAALAEVVLSCSAAGDPAARRIVDQGAGEIVQLAETTVRRLNAMGESLEVVLSGGLMGAASEYYEACRREIGVALPRTRVMRPLRPPMWGAIRLIKDREGES